MSRHTLELADDKRLPGTTTKQARARKRVVYARSDYWIVIGDPKLSDSKASYHVDLPEGERKYHCSCYTSQYGDKRSRSMCTHVLAVIMCRRGKMEFAGEGGEDSRRENRKELTRQGSYPSPANSVLPKQPTLTLVNSERQELPEVDDPAPTTQGVVATIGQHKAGGHLGQPFEVAPDPNHPMFGLPPIPGKFEEFRDQQWEAITETVEHFQSGIKVVFLGAPTGSGKTLIAETVRRLYGVQANDHPKGNLPYVCTTKSLQNQILSEFPYGRMVKGRANYQTAKYPNSTFITADDCDTNWGKPEDCSYCPHIRGCPYQRAKQQAADAPLGILNMAYYLGECMAEKGSMFRGRDLVVIDEADELEKQLMGFIEVVLTPFMRRQIGVSTLPKKTISEDWRRWLVDEIVPGIDQRRKALGQGTLFTDDTATVKMKKEKKRLSDLRKRVIDIAGDVSLDDGWVFTGYEGKEDYSRSTLKFKPIRLVEYDKGGEITSDLVSPLLWHTGDKFLLMSASFVSAETEAINLGLEDHEWVYVEMQSRFPVERRPVFIQPVAAVTKKNEDVAYPKVAEGVQQIVEENPGVRILVHTVSYRLTDYLYTHVNSDRVMTYWSAKERDAALEKFLLIPDAVMLAPSFERGVDLPGEHCQVIVIAKVPWPYLGDKQVKARTYGRGGQTWYSVQTIRAIVQMTGRGMRSVDDWCDTYILDSSFKRLYRDHKRLFPQWWRDALVLSRTDPKYKPLIQAAESRRQKRGIRD